MEEVTTETSTEQAHGQRQPIGERKVSKGMGVGKPGTSWESLGRHRKARRASKESSLRKLRGSLWMDVSTFLRSTQPRRTPQKIPDGWI